MPISQKEFYEFSDENWKKRVYNFLSEKRETETPAYGVKEIAKNLSTFDSQLPDTKRKVEWALVDLTNEGKVLRTKIRLNEHYYYMLE